MSYKDKIIGKFKELINNLQMCIALILDIHNLMRLIEPADFKEIWPYAKDAFKLCGKLWKALWHDVWVKIRYWAIAILLILFGLFLHYVIGV